MMLFRARPSKGGELEEEREARRGVKLPAQLCYSDVSLITHNAIIIG